MALQTSSPASAPNAQLVGNAFVEQYYLILHKSPELVFRFYQDSSVLTHPDRNGVMASVTTMHVKVMKENTPTLVYVAKSIIRVAPANTDRWVHSSAAPVSVPETPAPSSDNVPEGSSP